MGNGANFSAKRSGAAPVSTARWPDDLGRIESWQRQVQEASAHDTGTVLVGDHPLVNSTVEGRTGNSTRVPFIHSLSCPDGGADPILRGPAVVPTGRMVPPCASQGLHFDSTVKVYCVSSRPNFLQPWQMKAQQVASGSGFVVEGRCILTNAHVVDEYTTVRVRKHGHPMKYNARVLCIGHECDLALLEVQEEEFWEGLVPVKVNPRVLPRLYENAMVVGYPMGGDNVCVTRGVVSRITTLKYEPKSVYIGGPELLTIQIDAAINSGNSGGPVFLENGQVVGMAFSGYAGNADNIGYVIPCCVISNFITDFRRNGGFSGIAELGFSYQWMENGDLKSSMKMSPKQSGILVTRIPPLALQAKFIRRHDIVMEIEGVRVGDDGTVPLREGERVNVEYLASNHPVGETMAAKILRGGKLQTIQCPMGPIPRTVTRSHDHGVPPSYYIIGGLVFSPMTTGLLFAATDDFTEEAWQASRNPKQHRDEELVILLSVLAHTINNGYTISKLPQVEKVNGKKIRNLRQLRAEAESIREGFLKFDFTNHLIITLDARKCRESSDEILRMYAIPSHCSQDLLSNDGHHLCPAPSVTLSTFSLSTT